MSISDFLIICESQSHSKFCFNAGCFLFEPFLEDPIMADQGLGKAFLGFFDGLVKCSLYWGEVP